MDRTLVVRQAVLSDSDAVRAFVTGLSPQTQYLRFFACVAPPSSALLHALCGTAGRADVLLVTDARGVVVAHGMAADEPASGQPQRRDSNIGLVVADEWQRHGIGTALLGTLTGRAAHRGIHSLVLEVLPDNRVMLGIIRRHWPDAPAERTADAIVFRPAIERAAVHHAVSGAIHIRRPADLSAPGRSAA